MNSLYSNLIRLDAYRDKIEQLHNVKSGDSRVSYVIANLALDQLKISVERAEEPTERSFEIVEAHFEQAASTTSDPFLQYRSRLLRAWTRPIVWSDVINMGTLSDKESKRVAMAINIRKSADETAIIAADALRQYDDDFHASEEYRDLRMTLRGFLNETTPFMLASRHATAKAFAVPTTDYDDSIHPDKSLHVDGLYFDNRPKRLTKKTAFQVESTTGSHRFIRSSIPIINARQLGNLSCSSSWPKDDRAFMTVRHIVDERIGDGVDAETSSRLDRINSKLVALLFPKPHKS